MGIEIERRFLVEKEKWEQSLKGERKLYQQGYLVIRRGKTVRVRIAGEEGYLTIKGPRAGLGKPEFEYLIPLEDAQQMISIFCTNTVKKWRYKVIYEGHLWEVDEFLDENEGLMIAELELDHEAKDFPLPEWAGKEITGVKKYSNSSLSILPYKTWIRLEGYPKFITRLWRYYLSRRYR